MEELVFKTGAYEGPLELLLALIAKNKMNIFDIQITVIFEQYMAYVETMQRMDMEIAGEFITMASELMLIKSKMLLPRNEETEEDPCVSVEFQVESDKANYNVDLGFVCRKQGVLPPGTGEGKTQKWTDASSSGD